MKIIYGAITFFAVISGVVTYGSEEKKDYGTFSAYEGVKLPDIAKEHPNTFATELSKIEASDSWTYKKKVLEHLEEVFKNDDLAKLTYSFSVNHEEYYYDTAANATRRAICRQRLPVFIIVPLIFLFCYGEFFLMSNLNNEGVMVHSITCPSGIQLSRSTIPHSLQKIKYSVPWQPLGNFHEILNLDSCSHNEKKMVADVTADGTLEMMGPYRADFRDLVDYAKQSCCQEQIPNRILKRWEKQKRKFEAINEKLRYSAAKSQRLGNTKNGSIFKLKHR